MHTHTIARTVWTWKHMNAPVAPLLQRVATEQLMLVSTGGRRGERAGWLPCSRT